MPTNTYKFLTVFLMVCLIDKKQWILKDTFFDSPPPSCHRSSEQSIFPYLLSVEQKRSPHILPESRAFKNQSPHISPTTRAEICCKVPIKRSPYSPTSTRGPPSGKPMTSALLWQRFCHSGKRGPGNETLKKRKKQTAFYNRFQPRGWPR